MGWGINVWRVGLSEHTKEEEEEEEEQPTEANRAVISGGRSLPDPYSVSVFRRIEIFLL